MDGVGRYVFPILAVAPSVSELKMRFLGCS